MHWRRHSPHNPYVTEAGQMAKWLEEQGIAPERIIVENRSISTEENAMFAYRILQQDYPQIRSIALVSSDYHLRRCHLLFRAALVLPEPDLNYTIVGDACFDAGYPGEYEGYLEETSNLGRMLDLWTVNLPKPELSVLTGIQVSGTTEYGFGEALNLTVTADYDNGYRREMTSGFEISGFDPGLSGLQEVRIHYTENGVTMEASLTVTVMPQPTTEPPATETEPTIPTSLPPESVPITPTQPAENGQFPLIILVSIPLALLLLRLMVRPRRGKYEKRRKA